MLPSAVFAVIVAFPTDTAVTDPVDETVATFGLLDVQVTVLSVALAGYTVAVSCSVSPTFNEVLDLLIEIDVTNRFLTVIVQDALKLLPSFVVAVMTAVPTDLPITVPSLFTLATLGLLEVQFNVLFEAYSGKIVAVIFNVSLVYISLLSMSRLNSLTKILNPDILEKSFQHCADLYWSTEMYGTDNSA